MIRAYRMRGHLHANLDPLEPRAASAITRSSTRDLWLHRGRLRPPDLHRPCAGPRIRDPARDARRCCERTYCGDHRLRVHAYLRPEQKAWMQERIEGPDKEITFTPEGKQRDPQQADRGRRLREIPRRAISPAPSASGSTAAKSMIPALEQIIKRGGAARRARDRARHGASRPAQRAHQCDGQAVLARSSTSSRAAPPRPTTSKARATSNIISAPPPTASSTATQVHLSLTANPSHLEIVDPVVLGKVRAKQDQHH